MAANSVSSCCKSTPSRVPLSHLNQAAGGLVRLPDTLANPADQPTQTVEHDADAAEQMPQLITSSGRIDLCAEIANATNRVSSPA